MKYVRNILYAIVLLLFLEVIKTVIQKKHLPSSYFLGTMIAGLQFVVCLGIAFSVIIGIFFRRQVKKRTGLLLAGGIFLLLIVAMECLSVYWLNHPPAIPGALMPTYRYYYEQYDRNIIQYDGKLATYDSSTFYTFKPGIDGLFTNAEFSTHIKANSIGLRDDEASLNKPAVICVGDSYAMGWGVEQHETFSKQLQDISGLKVLNGGMSSFATPRELNRLKNLDTTALQYLIVQYCVNDYDETAQYLQNARKLKISSAIDYDSLVQMQSWNATYFPGKVFTTVAQIFLKMQINRIRPLFPLHNGQYKDPNDKLQAAKFLEVLDDPAINYQKIKLIVVFVDESRFRNSTFAEELQTLAQQMPYKQKFATGITVVNMFKYLSEEDYYQLDTHLRPSGHKKIADKVWEIIKQQ